MPTKLAEHRLIDVTVLTEGLLAERGVRVIDAEVVSVGGGLGSFALVDLLRVTGMPADRIRVVSPERLPGERFLRLCAVSGLRDDDPLRSDSSARIDNVWGFPSYAMEQAWRERKRGRAALAPLLRVLAEPVFAEFYTPSPALVRTGLEREAARIGWADMLVDGIAVAVRRRAGGGYFVLVRPSGDGSRLLALRCRFAHLGLGYAGLRHGDASPEFRAVAPDKGHLVHAYEPHEHCYRTLAARGGSVLVRGAGIAASRVLQRLIDDRAESGQDVRIWQVFRHYPDGGSGRSAFRGKGGCGFNYQPFNFPKAAFGGQLRDRTRRLPAAERAELISSMGGTTTPYRRQWARQLRTGRERGWYQAVVGQVTRLRPQETGIAVRVRPRHGKPLTLEVDFVIDATGLDPDAGHHPLLADLLTRSAACRNSLGGLDVAPDFQLTGMAGGAAGLYVSGVAAAGGYLAPVDSFAGLQYAALAIADSLAAQGCGRALLTTRSLRAWWRWMRNAPP
ncbi:MAG: hypothetical protein ACRDQ7_00715 [Haloechinothrix sp.]